MRGIIRSLVVLALALSAAGCATEEPLLTGRSEALCSSPVQACDGQSGCMMAPGEYIEASFPGEKQVVVFTEAPDQQLHIRLAGLHVDHPGTALLIRTYEPDCETWTQADAYADDLIKADDGALSVDLTVSLLQPGAHVVQVFSDMQGAWIVTADVE
jgi:hypothetical protein